MPILTASTPISPTTASICARIISAGTGWTAVTPSGVLRGDRGDRGHRVAAEHGDGLDIRLNPRAAARIRAGDDQDPGRRRHCTPPSTRPSEAKFSMCTSMAPYARNREQRVHAADWHRRRRCRRPAARPAPASSPSAMTRISGSVPDLRITRRPRPSSSASAAAIALLHADPLRAARAAVEADVLEQLRHRLELAQQFARRACRASTSAASTCSPATRPSPVVEWSVRMMWPDCSPPTLQPRRASPRARSGRRPRCAVSSSPASASFRSSPRLDITVATTAPPVQLAAPMQRRARSAPSAGRRRPGRPVSSTTISRSASPSSARPMSAPLATTASLQRLGMGRSAAVVDVGAVGRDAERDHFGAQFPQRLGRDVVGGAIGAIDRDLEAVEPQMIGKGRLGEMDIAAARIVDPPRPADQLAAWRASACFSSSARSPARPRR